MVDLAASKSRNQAFAVEKRELLVFHGAYQGRKVFVTGHTGFKGSWLAAWLLELGAEVTGYSLYVPSEPSHFEALGLKGRVKSLEGDILNSTQLAAAVKESGAEIFFHLAAQPIVSESFAKPKLTFETNAIGTLNVMEAARSTSALKALVMITSDKCYENVEWEYGFRENDRLGGKDPYSASKACAEVIVSSYWRSFFEGHAGMARVATARAGNVIGGGDWAKDRIVPDCVRAWAKNGSAVLRNPRSTRPWQHVLEPLSGYLALGAGLYRDQVGLSGEAFNFGPGADVTQSVEVLVQDMAKIWLGRQWTKNEPVASMKEASLLKLCCDKALARLKWLPTLTFDETVEYTANW